MTQRFHLMTWWQTWWHTPLSTPKPWRFFLAAVLLLLAVFASGILTSRLHAAPPAGALSDSTLLPHIEQLTIGIRLTPEGSYTVTESWIMDTGPLAREGYRRHLSKSLTVYPWPDNPASTEAFIEAPIRITPHIKVTSVTLDGKPHPYDWNTSGDGWILSIPRSEAWYAEGQYRFQVVYEVERGMAFIPASPTDPNDPSATENPPWTAFVWEGVGALTPLPVTSATVTAQAPTASASSSQSDSSDKATAPWSITLFEQQELVKALNKDSHHKWRPFELLKQGRQPQPPPPSLEPLKPQESSEADVPLPSQVLDEKSTKAKPVHSHGDSEEAIPEDPPENTELTPINEPLDLKQPVMVGERWRVQGVISPGAILPPSPQQEWGWWVSEHQDILLLWIGILLLTIYFITIWVLRGREPEAQTVAPKAEVPDSLTGWQVYSLTTMGVGGRSVAAALVDMAVSGHIGFSVEADTEGHRHQWRIVSLQEPNEPNHWQTPLYQYLFPLQDSGVRPTEVADKKLLHKRLTHIRNHLHQQWTSSMAHQLYRTNSGYLMAGHGLSLVFLLLSTLMAEPVMLLGKVGQWAFPLGLTLTATLLSITCIKWCDRRWFWASMAQGITTLGISIALLITLMGLMATVTKSVSPWYVAGVFALVLLNVLARRVLPAYTPAGRRMLDRLIGFRAFLEGTDTLDAHVSQNLPRLQVQQFLPNLSVAHALGTVIPWARQFGSARVHFDAPSDGFSVPWFELNRKPVTAHPVRWVGQLEKLILNPIAQHVGYRAKWFK